MRAAPRTPVVAQLQGEFSPKRDAIRSRLKEFAEVPRAEYFYELAYCLLTPQSSAVNAAKAVDRLKQTDPGAPEKVLAAVLFCKDHYIRFHNTKAKRLRKAASALPEILAALDSGRPSSELRAWLVANVDGLGWKEASHFLRNIGHRDLAILDRHILKNLRRHGVIRALPKSLTRARYLKIERKFLQFARAIGLSIDELDLLFWSRETGEILK